MDTIEEDSHKEKSSSPSTYSIDSKREILAKIVDATITPQDLELILERIETYHIQYAYDIVQNALEEHKNDPCLPPHKYEIWESLVSMNEKSEEWELRLKFEAFIIDEWSVYPEVRSCTRPIDEPEGLQETWRVYALGILWSCAGSCLATFFANRYPSISLGSSAIQILIMFSGRALSMLPKCSVKVWGKTLELNPGRWSFKEQMLTTLTMSVSVGYPYALSAITAQVNEHFYGIENVGIGYMLMLTISSQFMGFGIAGLMRTFLVYPVQCVWYSVLPTITLNRSLVEHEQRISTNGWRLTRFEIFGIMLLISFIWYWVTNFLFQGLSYFDWIAWIKPNNINIQALTGCITGLALNPVPTFDWNIIDQGGMVAPFFATANAFLGTVISTFAIIIIWYTNVRWTSYLPINSNLLFANNGSAFSVRKILNGKGILDLDKLKQYSLPFYSAGNIVNYGSFFMIYPAMFVYAILNYGSTMLSAFSRFTKGFTNPKKALEQHNDRFSRAQRKYREVPETWFLFILVASLGMAVATVEYYSFTNTPVWTIFFGAGLAIVFTVPFGILYARTNASLDINVLFEIIIGYALAGNGNALMVSKVYATNFMAQTDNYITNQVQAHYTGIAPRVLFRLQMLSVICNTFVQIGILYWQLNGGIKNLCAADNIQKFTCQDSRTFFNSSVIWGVLGPKRIFSAVYPTMSYCFLIGAAYPIVFWAVRKITKKKLNYLNEMVILVGCMAWAPSNWMYKLPNLYIAILFNWYIKRKFPQWWQKYNYILSASLRVGVAYAALIKFFSTEYTSTVELNWWGNTVSSNNLDATNGAARLAVPAQGYFGPDPQDVMH